MGLNAGEAGEYLGPTENQLVSSPKSFEHPVETYSLDCTSDWTERRTEKLGSTEGS